VNCQQSKEIYPRTVEYQQESGTRAESYFVHKLLTSNAIRQKGLHPSISTTGWKASQEQSGADIAVVLRVR